ncbi:4'-phosphopantetheinyl transferase family protein [Silvanigrella aquatica]|uniref:Uncharacterized protein n=1 Tax=Silvanigrella aquatica TaxID=1915309 RepID=A0A1L4D3W3_9BACT|nr:4'-phosphopantetheinyl transferase superfamily protein [Silvanigrella aquatica]APJ04888.1 hypothetical protein AXG55_13690 [Silvanigrella aquatica]
MMKEVTEWKNFEKNNEIQKDEVHIWKIKIPYDMFKYLENKNISNYLLSNDFFNGNFKKVLTLDEINKSLKYFKISDKIRSLSTRFVLKKLISLYLKLPPHNIHFKYNKYFKPFLSHEINNISLNFNVSHAGEYIVLAFSCEDLVGIDIEKYDNSLDKNSLGSYIFSDCEFTSWNSLSENEKNSSFYHVWSCKEAILKGIGIGLSYLPNNITVGINPNENPKIISLKDCKYENHPDSWSIRRFYIQNDYSSIFAIRKKNFKSLFYEWDWNNVSIC